MDLDLFNSEEESPRQQEVPRSLTCSCPKCSTEIELSFEQVLDDTDTKNCPECNARYVLTREPFARRAARKAGEINCAECGGRLDQHQYCPSCKALYPDYYAAEHPDAAKKRERKKRDYFGWLKGLSFELPSRTSASFEYKPATIETDAWNEPESTPAKSSARIIRLGVGAVALIAITTIGYVTYNHIQAKKRYISTYVISLYGMKMGSDLGLKTRKQYAADWTVRVNAGQTSPPPISVDTENQLNKIKQRTDGYLKKLSDPPDGFADANEKLMQLNAVYNKIYAASLNPSGSLANHVESTQKFENEYRTSVDNLKKSIPGELTKELEVAKLKYNGLKDI